jgi:hypothetical protein
LAAAASGAVRNVGASGVMGVTAGALDMCDLEEKSPASQSDSSRNVLNCHF